VIKRYVLLVPVCVTVLIDSANLQAQPSRNLLYNLAEISEGVGSHRVSSYRRSGENRDRYEDIKDGETLILFDKDGPGIINHIWITIAPWPQKLSRNDIILRMFWDGEKEPSVQSPIGPFFGQGWKGSYNFSSLPLIVGPREGRALTCYFTMPFDAHARIEILNDTGRTINAFYYYIDYVKMEKLPEAMGRFHAEYRKEVTEPLEESELSEIEADWSAHRRNEKNTTGAGNYVIADIEGEGHFVGSNYYVNSPTPVWYGEGDDMFFIDGEEWPPSLHGTGTEDYFNTAWVPDTEFSHPLFGIAHVNTSLGWMGRTHLYRFHILDPVYFDESLEFSIEHGHNNTLELDLASVAYWYQNEPHKPFQALPNKEARHPKPFVSPGDIHQWRYEWKKSLEKNENSWK